MSVKPYKAPVVPTTPSKAINDMLKKNCDKTFESAPKAALAYAICYFFQAVTMLYNAIHKDQVASHRKWMGACGGVSAAVVVVSYLLFRTVLGCSYLLYSLLYYGTFTMGLFGVGLGVAGMVFFDKEGSSSRTEGFESTGQRIGRKFDDAREQVDEWKNQ